MAGEQPYSIVQNAAEENCPRTDTRYYTFKSQREHQRGDNTTAKIKRNKTQRIMMSTSIAMTKHKMR